MKRHTIDRKKRLRKRKLKSNRRQYFTKRNIIIAGIIILILLFFFMGIYIIFFKNKLNSSINVDASRPEISVQLLDINEYSRPGIESDPITGIVIHYTANPGSTAQNNRDYFNSLQDGHGTFVSSHFVVGLEGEIVQCVPTWEIAYASNERNHDTISIECCHWDETGEFTEETYASVIQLTAFLCDKYGLYEKDVIRHYDVTGKNCPKYFVENEGTWEQFQTDVAAALARGNGEENE